MKIKPVAAACGLWILGAGMLAAEQASSAGTVTPAARQPVVVEFFTSQGCSSCPPADALFGLMTEDPGLIPLALHVDYWDYIGWQDNFAQPAFTERQKAYARAAGSRTIYTPQMIVSGAIRVEGNDADALAAAIGRERAHRAAPEGASLSVTREAGGVRIRAAAPADPAGWRVQLVRYIPEESIDITHGENAGRRVSYRNIVTDWRPVANWPGQPPLDLFVPVEGDAPAVVLIQREGPGEIIAAARLD